MVKKLLILLFCSSIIQSCNQRRQGHFVEFDKIEYYYLETNSEVLYDLERKENKNKVEQTFIDLIIWDTPESLQDTSFVKILSQMGFKRTTISSSNESRLDKIFFKDPDPNNIEMACIDFFRDILIFKKNNSVRGIVKIDTYCGKIRIVRSNSVSSRQRSSQDFRDLIEILKEEKL